MKKIVSLLALVGLISVIITGYGSTSSKKSETVGTVSTDGSTSMEKVIGYLSEAYMEENPDVKITYNPTGSGSGIQAVGEGRCDIGLSSRDLKDDEKSELSETVIAIDGIAIIVNPENQISDLTIEKIAALYKGKITNWKEVGGSNAPVVLIGREDRAYEGLSKVFVSPYFLFLAKYNPCILLPIIESS